MMCSCVVGFSMLSGVFVFVDHFLFWCVCFLVMFFDSKCCCFLVFVLLFLCVVLFSRVFPGVVDLS